MKSSPGFSEELTARGQLRITIQRANGTVERFIVKNKVVAAGTAFYASRAIGNTTAPVSHMALGTGTTAVADEDPSLEAEIAGSRVAVTSSASGNTVTYTAVFGPGVGTGPLTEAGLFNAGVAGTMTCRSVFGVKTKDAGDQVTIAWDNVINNV